MFSSSSRSVVCAVQSDTLELRRTSAVTVRQVKGRRKSSSAARASCQEAKRRSCVAENSTEELRYKGGTAKAQDS